MVVGVLMVIELMMTMTVFMMKRRRMILFTWCCLDERYEFGRASKK
jgi:hypothetical protein